MQKQLWGLRVLADHFTFQCMTMTPSLFTNHINLAGLGPRSKTSLFYEAFSLSSGLDFSSSESSRGRAGDSSGSSSSSLSPTSGYSSYDILDTLGGLGANRDIGNFNTITIM